MDRHREAKRSVTAAGMKTSVTILLFCVAALVTLGLVMLYSLDMGSETHYFHRQLRGVFLGVVGCAAAASFPYQWLRRLAWVVFAGCLLFLSLVFVPGLGVTAKGSSRWVVLFGFQFQPSEFAKIGLIIVMAHYLAAHPLRLRRFRWGIFLPGLLAAPVLALILVEWDFSTTILLAAVCGVMLVVAGVRLRLLLPTALAAAVLIGGFIYADPNRRERIEALLAPEASKQDKGLQAYQARIALGSAGVPGRGLGDGRQKWGRIPENQTDFIFSVVGEELGLAGSLLVTTTYVVFVFCGITIAKYARDNFGTMVVVGTSFLVGFQAFINIGVVTGMLPNTGMALPFVSLGGSNLLALMTAVGIMVSIARQASVNPFEFEATCQRAGEISATRLS